MHKKKNKIIKKINKNYKITKKKNTKYKKKI